MRWLLREPERDPELAAALRQMDAGPEAELGDAEALRQRIMAAAGPRLAELRAPAPHWWEWISRWMRVAIPIGVAASIAAGLVVRATPELADETTVAAAGEAVVPGVQAGGDSTLVLAALSAPSSQGQLAAQLIAPEEDDWLLQQVVTQ